MIVLASLAFLGAVLAAYALVIAWIDCGLGFALGLLGFFLVIALVGAGVSVDSGGIHRLAEEVCR